MATDRRRLLIAVGLAVALLAGCSDSDGGAPVVEDPDATAQELVRRYVEILQSGDVDRLDAFVSDAFQIQRADGSSLDKAAYLDDYSTVGEVEFGDEFSGAQDGDVFTVVWSIEGDIEIDGEPLDDAQAPRLTTFAYRDGEWLLTSHANFAFPASVDGR